MRKLTIHQRGFTLIELLIVLALIAIVAAAVIIAINPAQNFQDARNTQRWTNVNAILNAIWQNKVDNNGEWNNTACATDLPAALTVIGSVAPEIDICDCIVPTYVGVLPQDPQTGTGDPTCAAAYSAGYRALEDADGRVTVDSPDAEGTTISVTR